MKNDVPLCPGLLEIFQNNNALLEQIQKCLEAYLESKRVVFPRSESRCSFFPYSNGTLSQILFMNNIMEEKVISCVTVSACNNSEASLFDIVMAAYVFC